MRSNSFMTKWLLSSIILLLVFKATLVMSSPVKLDDDRNDDVGEPYKDFGTFTAPFLILGGIYVIFMWTKPIQQYILAKYRNMSPKEVRSIQNQIRPWLKRIHMFTNGIALIPASIHGLGIAIQSGFSGGGLPHLMIWIAGVIMSFYLIVGIILKLRWLSLRIRRVLRSLHRSPILIFLLAGLMLGHVSWMDDDYLK